MGCQPATAVTHCPAACLGLQTNSPWSSVSFSAEASLVPCPVALRPGPAAAQAQSSPGPWGTEPERGRAEPPAAQLWWRPMSAHTLAMAREPCCTTGLRQPRLLPHAGLPFLTGKTPATRLVGDVPHPAPARQCLAAVGAVPPASVSPRGGLWPHRLGDALRHLCGAGLMAGAHADPSALPYRLIHFLLTTSGCVSSPFRSIIRFYKECCFSVWRV